jgi:hypothetical protein
MPKDLHVGVDIGRARNAVCLVDVGGARVGRPFAMANNRPGAAAVPRPIGGAGGHPGGE